MMASIQHEKQPGLPSNTNYELIRKAGPYEIITHLFHKLGIQSNVLICSKYSHPTKTLTRNRVYRALSKVIKNHPSLSIIGVSLPSPEKKDRHIVWEARLPTIDLSQCVEFMDFDFTDGNFARYCEKWHNAWFEVEDGRKLWWKLVVVNGTQVVFVWHHFIGDGLSGYAFHQSFLAAANLEEGECEMEEDANSVIKVTAKELLPHPLEDLKGKLKWSYVFRGLLTYIYNQFFFKRKRFFFSDAVVSKTYPTLAKPLPERDRTVTKAEVLRIDNKTMKAVLTLCRENDTSFTALLQTLVQITLVTDIYPEAKRGISRVAVNLRPLLSYNTPDHGIFTSAVSTYAKVQCLKDYRISGSTSPPNSSRTTDSTSILPSNKPLVWKLASNHKSCLKSNLTSGQATQNFLTASLLSKYEEDIGSFSGMGLYPNNSFLISNLGAWEPLKGMKDNGWKIEDIRFSSGTIRGALSDFAMSFNVGSVKGGEGFVVATCEEGVLKEEVMRRVLDGVEGRLMSLL